MPLFTTSVRITVHNHPEWLGKEAVGLLDVSSLHSDLLLLAGDGGRFSTHRALLLPTCTQLAQLCSKEREKDVVHLPFVASSTIRCLLHLVYCGKCTLAKSEVGELRILASCLGLHLSPQSLSIQPALPRAVLEESDVVDKQEDASDSQGRLGVGEIKEESDSPKAAELKDRAPAETAQELCAGQAKIEAHRKLLRSLFQGSNREGYRCLRCGKTMAGQATALAHCEGHLNVSIPCTICPRMFKTRSGMYYHMKKVHGAKTFSRYSCDVIYNSAGVVNAGDKRLNTDEVASNNNQTSVVQDLDGALNAVLQKVKLEAEEEACCANEQKVVKAEGTLKFFDAGQDDMVDLTEKGKALAGDRSEVEENSDASALVKSSQPEKVHELCGIKRKREDLEKEGVVERRGKSDEMLKDGKVMVTDLSEAVETGKTRPKLSDLNTFLICNICKGYLVTATTVTNCLHSFCKSCLVKQMVDKNNSIFHCPTCRGPIEGLNGLREDRQLQGIVNQVVPGLEVKEGQRRKTFYEEHSEEETDQKE